ncbi:hypothetical protein B1689_16010 [Geobacillus sp. 44C]|nr:hypothetical protein B1689_16010 [Geobacillus sp. 44C]
MPKSFTHRLFAQEPIVTPGGTVSIVDTTSFPISTTIAAVWPRSYFAVRLEHSKIFPFIY